MSLKRCAEVYVLLLNLAYEGSPVNMDELVVEPQKQMPTGKGWLVRDEWAHAIADEMERDMRIMAAHYERKIERTRSVDVRDYREANGEAI
jgi:hypothetical protein